ncbi:hypothetical protein Micbo1qcDRAFT_208445 [Microdochium bolleyi]|uniref:Uncharacterized protein n=1 Tax=Microdochium bolleyi TaxID=196109 RepID=A0A136IQ46_9PEZI|nr:hypothetical protein Micbo1qcDRAFT_208445 [Microdochium bolleyi]
MAADRLGRRFLEKLGHPPGLLFLAALKELTAEVPRPPQSIRMAPSQKIPNGDSGEIDNNINKAAEVLPAQRTTSNNDNTLPDAASTDITAHHTSRTQAASTSPSSVDPAPEQLTIMMEAAVRRCRGVLASCCSKEERDLRMTEFIKNPSPAMVESRIGELALGALTTEQRYVAVQHAMRGGEAGVHIPKL